MQRVNDSTPVTASHWRRILCNVLDADRYYVTLTDTADPVVREFVRGQLRAFNDRVSEPHRASRAAGSAPLDILIRDDAGEIVGGLIGATYWGWLELDVLWIEERSRRRGYGRALLWMAEAEARTRGCSRVMLTTYSFQARGFYEREGYRVVGEMTDYPPGAAYYWMRKELWIGMDAPELIAITNFRRLAPDLITGGQPTEEQLAAAAAAGTEVVINLGRLDPAYALPDERGTVAALGMVYEHIPVVWTDPTPANLQEFFAVMERHAGRRVFVHCAANYRASAFIMLYRVLQLGWPIADALPDMRAIWNPAEYPAWQAFLEDALHGTKDLP